MLDGAGSENNQIGEGASHPASDAVVTEGAFVGSAPSVADTPPTPEAPAVDPAAADKEGILSLLADKFGDKTAEPPAEQTQTPDAHDPGDKPAEAEAPKEPEAEKAADPEPDEQDDPEDEKAEDALTDEERAAVPKAVQRKVSRLLRNVRRLQPDANAYRNITRFMAEKRLTGEEAARGFEIMALIKAGDPRALDALSPYLEQLNQAAGNVLPEDLRQRVDQGYMDEDSAKELARLRAQTQRIQDETRIREEETNLVVAQRAQQNISEALNGWEAKLIAAKDPDYLAVQKAVFDYAQASFTAKPPASADEAIQRVQSFYDSLKQGVRPKAASGVARPPQPTRPGPSSAASPPVTPAREPATLEEAIRLTLQKRGAA